jgi:hypothetical protein
MGLVLGQHHRALGELGDALAQAGQDLVAVGVALGDQPGPPPRCQVADAAAQGLLADGRSAELGPQPTDRPGLRLV